MIQACSCALLIVVAFFYFFSVKCAPGTYSGNGVEPCIPCAKGSYQVAIGALACIECTAQKSTYGPGADAADMCVGKMDQLDQAVFSASGMRHCREYEQLFLNFSLNCI